MDAMSARRTLLPLSLVVALQAAAHAQATAPAPAPAPPSGATAAWTLKMKGDIRWQQVTPAGAPPLSTHRALSGGGNQRGRGTRAEPPPRRAAPGTRPHRPRGH